MVRHQGEHYGFFLEYDRGTMSARDYAEKWAVYYDYRDSRAYELDYNGFPTILVVTNGNPAEERIVRSVRAASIGRATPLPCCSPATGGSTATHQIKTDCSDRSGASPRQGSKSGVNGRLTVPLLYLAKNHPSAA